MCMCVYVYLVCLLSASFPMKIDKGTGYHLFITVLYILSITALYCKELE